MNIEQGKIRITETQEKLKCRRNIVSLLCVGKVVSLKEMTDGPFLSGLGQMETNSHLSAWEVTITKWEVTITNASVRDAPMPHQSATTAIYIYLNENVKTLKSVPWKLGFHHNPAFTLRAPPLQPNWVDAIKGRLVWKGGRNSQQFLPP